MGLRIVTGRAGSGKTRLCLDEINKRIIKSSLAGGIADASVSTGADVESIGVSATKNESASTHASTSSSVDGEVSTGGSAEPGALVSTGVQFYLVPEQSNLATEQSLFEHCGTEGLIDAAVITFRRMSHRIFTELGALNRQYIDGAGKRIVISSVVEDNRDSLSYYLSQSHTSGFIDELCSVFTEFKQFNITAEKIKLMQIDSNSELSIKLGELFMLFDKYCERIDAEYLDTDDDLTRLATLINRSAIIKASEIWIDDFYWFTNQEYEVIGELAKYAKSVTICLCCEREQLNISTGDQRKLMTANGTTLFNPTCETFSELIARVKAYNVEIELLHLDDIKADGTSRNELIHLEKQIYRDSASVFRGSNDAVFLRESADCYGEVESAAAGIRALCREYGYKYNEITVICSDLEKYAHLVKPIFDSHGLRCFIDIKNEITDHPLVRIILSLFAIIESGFAFEPVFSYLKTGVTSLSQHEIDRLENYVLARGIRGGMWTNNKIWLTDSAKVNVKEGEEIEEKIEKEEDEEIDKIEKKDNKKENENADLKNIKDEKKDEDIKIFKRKEKESDNKRKENVNLESKVDGTRKYENYTTIKNIRDRFLRPIIAFMDSIGKRCDPTVFCVSLYRFLEDCGAIRKINEIMKAANLTPGDRAEYSEWKQIWEYTVKILEQIIETGSSGGYDTDKSKSSVYFNMFKCGVNGYKVGAIPPSSDEILVGSVDRTRSRKVKALFVLGANEGLFPGIAKPSSLLNDDNRIKMRGTGVQISKDKVSASFDSNFIVYKTFTAATRFLFVSWTATDSSGRVAKPSHAVKVLVRMFKITTGNLSNDNYIQDTIENFALRTCSIQAALEELVRELRVKGADERLLPPEWSAVHDWMRKNDVYTQKINAILPFFNYRSPSIKLSELTAATLLGDDETSVSRLERYAACPFSFFGEYIIKARPRKEHKIEAPDIGSFVHKAIEQTAHKLSDEGSWGDLTIERSRLEAAQTVEILLAENDDSAFLANYRNRHQKNRITEMVAWSIYASSRHIAAGAYTPWKYEMPFEGFVWQNLVKLRGVVDRVDVANVSGKTYVRIVDYKTGRKKLTVNDIIHGLTIQLPIYLDAAIYAVDGNEIDDGDGGGSRSVSEGGNEVDDGDGSRSRNVSEGGNENRGLNGKYSENRSMSWGKKEDGNFNSGSTDGGGSSGGDDEDDSSGRESAMPGGLFYYEVTQPYYNAKKTGRGEAAIDVTDIDEKLLNMMKMSGYTIGDEELYKETYEKDISENLSSKIINGVTIKRDGGFRATVFAPNPAEYDLIRREAAARVHNIKDSIVKGVFDVSPYKKQDASPCAYCLFRGACGFDIIKQDGAVRVIKKIGDKELLKQLRIKYEAGRPQ